MKKKLKLGFLVPPHHRVPAWYHRTITEVMKNKDVETVFVEADLSQKKMRVPWMVRLFRRFEQWWFHPQYDAFEEMSLDELAHPSRFLPWNEHAFPPGEPVFKDRDFDVLFCPFDPQEMKARLSRAATYGLWYIDFGFGRYESATLPGFHEVMEDSPVTGSRLLACRGGVETVAYAGTSPSVPYSARNNYNSIAWKSSSYLPLRLAELIFRGESFFGEHSSLPGTGHRVPGVPGNGKMLFLFLRNLYRYVVYKLRGRFQGRYTLLYSSPPSDPINITNGSFTPVPLPKGRFFADPFIAEEEGKNFIFFEEYSDAVSKAHISVMEWDPENGLKLRAVVLEKPFHLSYPCVFRHRNNWYMVPETAANKTVELYRAADFPVKWEWVMNLWEDDELIDVTLHHDGQKWWMFACRSLHPAVSTNDQLFLYYSDDLFSKSWTPHPQNPIATHAENCRPAGRLFFQDGKLCRPAQNNASKQYGYGLVINEVLELNEYRYAEKPLVSYKPEQMGLKACHHIDFNGTLMVIDGVK
jgi:hypothetical protein